MIHGRAEKGDGIGCQKVDRNRVNHQQSVLVGARCDNELASSDLGMKGQSDGQIAKVERTDVSGKAPADDDTAGIAAIDPAWGNFASG
jgi:hypothetical protein